MQKKATGKINTTLAIIPTISFSFPWEFALRLNPLLIQQCKYNTQSAFIELCRIDKTLCISVKLRKLECSKILKRINFIAHGQCEN